MRIIVGIILGGFISLQGCTAQPVKSDQRKEFYTWINFEIVQKDSTGKVIGIPKWEGPNHMKYVDSFVVYHNEDSIRMFTPDAPGGKILKKAQIHASRWVPKPAYANKLFFVGTYFKEELDGMYVSIYASRDWSSLMQIYYTNPGNLNFVILFCKDSVNVLKKEGIIIDPNEEISEPEQATIGTK